MMTIKQFCDKHDACESGREWALSLGIRSMKKLWERDDINLEWRLWIATRSSVMSDKDLRLFSCWCVRQVWHLLTDERSRNAVDVAERYAIGETTREELDAALDAARAAALDAARAAALDAARAAAWDAALDAARAAALDAAWAAAWDAAWDEQSKKLMEYDVCFDGGVE